jgi:hypothetical protein
MQDSEDISTKNKVKEDVIGLVGVIPMHTVKVSIFIFILFIIISSSAFIDNVLYTKSGRFSVGRECTAAGVVLSGLILSLSYAGINTMVCKGLL